MRLCLRPGRCVTAVSVQVREIWGERCVILPYGKSNEVSCIFSCGVAVSWVIKTEYAL